MAARPVLSIVIPCYNEEEVFPLLRQRTDQLIGQTRGEFDVEVLFIDDGSRDRTWPMIEAYAQSRPEVRGLGLSRNFGHQRALTCGYDACQGDVIVSMDADLQDPPELVLEMLDKWRQGADVVHAVRRTRDQDTIFKRATASAFYALIRKAAGPYIEDNVEDFRLMSRRALNAFNRMREEHRYIRGMVGWMGFQVDRVYFDRPARAAGVTKYTFVKMFTFAIDAIVSFSATPLRLAYYVALTTSALVFVYWGYVIWEHFAHQGSLVPGWTSLLLTTTLFGCSNLICLGIMGEYIGRLYDQSKQRPLYLVKTESDAKASGMKLLEFDRYSRDYHKSIAHPLRALMESSGENEFLRAKARWIDDWWARSGRPRPRVLDYGCGTGMLTEYLHDLRPDWSFHGTDPSQGMIDAANVTAPFADFSILLDGQTPCAGRLFDLVLMSGVLHHIPSREWDLTFAQVRSVLTPRGTVFIFEHNPFNPVTQFVVRTTPIDRDARLQTSSFVMKALRRCGFEVESRRYLHFFPPRFRAAQSLERKIAWLPLGSQYLVQARLARASDGRG